MPNEGGIIRTAHTRRCVNCRRAVWTCRVCGVRVCKHLCTSKRDEDMTAVCSACKGRPMA